MTRHDPSLARQTSQTQGVQPIIVLELNELCPHLLDRWMAEGRLPNFKALHDRAAVLTTEADVEDSACLEPWIQWYSMHTGLAYAQHRVFHLTEGAGAGHDDIYSAARAAGRKVSCFASMNVAPFAQEGSVFVGDPWSEHGDAFPPELNIYNRFVSQNVREYSNVGHRMGAAEYAQFLNFMLGHGLKPGTIARILRQLAREKTNDARISWQRVALLDAMQWDVFQHYYDRQQPHLATFFANSTAHLQHSYWRHHAPESFTIRPDDAEMALYGDAVRFGYEQMDRLVGDATKLARRNGARLIFAGALSQQPFLKHEETGGQHFYRLGKVEAFLAKLGITARSVDPTMTHQYLASFGSVADAQAARERLEALRLPDGRVLIGFPTKDAAPGSIYFGCQIATTLPADQTIIDAQSNQPIRFFDDFYKIEAIKSGRHHPEGALWVESPKARTVAQKVSILDVYPTLCELLQLAPPPVDRRGKSLVSVIG